MAVPLGSLGRRPGRGAAPLRAAGLAAGLVLALAPRPVRADHEHVHSRHPRPARVRSGGAPSGSLRDGEAGYQIVIAPGWVPLDPPSGTLLAYQAPAGHARLAVTRVDVGSRSPRTFARVTDDVERGVKKVTEDYQRIRRRTGQVGRVRTLDLWYRRGDRTTVLMRYLFHHTYTVVLSIGLGPGAARADRHAARHMLRSFTIFPP